MCRCDCAGLSAGDDDGSRPSPHFRPWYSLLLLCCCRRSSVRAKTTAPLPRQEKRRRYLRRRECSSRSGRRRRGSKTPTLNSRYGCSKLTPKPLLCEHNLLSSIYLAHGSAKRQYRSNLSYCLACFCWPVFLAAHVVSTQSSRRVAEATINNF